MSRAIPLTPPGPLWSQREYVECVKLGIGFAAHRASDIDQWFHYAFPADIGCASVRVGPAGPVSYVDHAFVRDIGWIDRCRAAVARVS